MEKEIRELNEFIKVLQNENLKLKERINNLQDRNGQLEDFVSTVKSELRWLD